MSRASNPEFDDPPEDVDEPPLDLRSLQEGIALLYKLEDSLQQMQSSLHALSISNS